MVQTAIQRYKERQHPSNRQLVKEMLIHAVYGQLGKSESEELDGLIDRLTDSLCSPTHQELEYDTNIFHIAHTMQEPDDLEDVRTVLQPVKFPLLEEIQQVSPDMQLEPTWDMENEKAKNQPQSCIMFSVTTTQQRDLADTGASVSATGIKGVRHPP
jgi:hypothetical protein